MRPRGPVLGLGLAVGVIAVATLTPNVHAGPAVARWCLFCGERGLSDAVLNVGLFAPFGAALAGLGRGAARAAAAGAGLSAVIELLQVDIVPGRDASVGDVVWNTAGALAGALAVRAAARLAAARVPVQRALLVGWVAVSAGAWAGTGLLFRPAPPRSVYFGQWTPDLAHLERYGGRVLAARLGPLELPPARLPDTVRALLVAGAPLRARVVAGAPPPRLAPVVSVYDDRQREVWLLGAERTDLVLRYRMRAAAVGLDQPDVRLRGAFRGVAPGDTVAFEAALEGRGACLRAGALRGCTPGFSAGRGWALLFYPERAAGAARAVDAAWMAGWAAPLGLLAPSVAEGLAAGGAAGAALVALSHVTGLTGPGVAELLGLMAGLGMGLVARFGAGLAARLRVRRLHDRVRRAAASAPGRQRS